MKYLLDTNMLLLYLREDKIALDFETKYQPANLGLKKLRISLMSQCKKTNIIKLLFYNKLKIKLIHINFNIIKKIYIGSLNRYKITIC